MSSKKIKVLYICGNGRSGSTILDIILGQIEGFFAVGELRRIWDRGMIENRPCGCETPFLECPTWNKIFQEAFGGMNNVDARRMVELRERYTQTKHLPGMLMGKHRNGNRGAEVETYLQTIGKLYKAIQKVSGSEVIVDSSKWPMYAYMVDALEEIELYIVHLIRDPRAYCHSFQRKKEYEPGKYLPIQGAFKSSSYWVTWNPSIERLWKHDNPRYLYFPYEEFALHPRQAIKNIVNMMDVGDRKLPFVDDQTVKLDKTHAVAGNVARLTHGPVKIRLDNEWQSKMPAARKLLVSTLTWPMMLRYGYLGNFAKAGKENDR